MIFVENMPNIQSPNGQHFHEVVESKQGAVLRVERIDLSDADIKSLTAILPNMDARKVCTELHHVAA